MKSEKSYFILLLAVGSVILFAHLGLLYVDIMEARNFVSAREMAHEGHWIFTTMNDLPRYEKPPLPTWLSAFMGMLFGFDHIGALRIPAALVCFAALIYLYKIVVFVTKNARLALISSLIFITSFLVIYVGRRANWDIFSYAFMIIGMYYFLLALKNVKTFPNYLVAGIFFGLSVLSKGPTGPYVLLIPMYIAYVLTNGFPKWKEIGGIAFCAVITIIIGFSWYGYVYLADSDTFLTVMEKEASARGNRDVKPFTRYLNFPAQTGIWIFFSVIGLIFPMMKKRTSQPRQYYFFFYWTVFAFIFLSLIPSKKERYLFPMMVPLAVTTGYYLYYLFTVTQLKKWEKKLNKVIFSILGIVCLALSVAIFFLPIAIGFYSVAFSLIAFAVGIYVLYSIFAGAKFEKAFSALLILMVGTALFGIPIIDQAFNNNTEHKSMLILKDQIENEKATLYSYEEYSPEVWFKYQEVMPEIKLNDAKTFPKENQFYVATNTEGKHVMQPFEKMGYQVTLVDRYDDNEEGGKSKNHTERKIHYVYKVQK